MHVIELQNKSEEYWAEVTCCLPSEFDTVYRWFNYNPEYNCYGSINYRSHSQAFEVVMETGIMQEPELDTGYYFTILHSTSAQCDSAIIIGPRDYTDFEKHLMKRNLAVSPQLKIDTGIVINGHEYNILSYNEILGESPFNRVEAYTTFNKRHLVFRLQNNIDNRNKFIEEANMIIRSIKIREKLN